MTSEVRTLLAFVGLVAIWFLWQWVTIERRRRSVSPGQSAGVSLGSPWDLAIGFITNFFDALGIGNFASTTAAFKLLKRMPDEEIPGTLNAGHTLPVLVEAFIFARNLSQRLSVSQLSPGATRSRGSEPVRRAPDRLPIASAESVERA